MEDAEYEVLRAQEDRYWWYLGLRRLALEGLLARLPADRPARVLDLGCGTGGMLAALLGALPHASLHGIDRHPLALRHAHARGAGTLVRGTADALPYPDASFDAVLALDLFYIREVEEQRALGEARRVLAPGGVLIVNLPAFELLRGEHDLAVHTRSRYTARDLGQKLRGAGFEVLRLTYWNAILFPLLLLRRRLRRPTAGAAPRSDLAPLPGALNALFSGTLALERKLLALVNLPFGSSVFAVARKA